MAESVLIPAGPVWVVKFGASGKSYWFPSAPEANKAAASSGRVTSNFVTKVLPGEEMPT